MRNLIKKNLVLYNNLKIKKIYKKMIREKVIRLENNFLDKDYKKEISNYWSNYGLNINYDWHRWYSSINNLKDIHYIPEDVFYTKILPFYNKLDFREAYADKGMHSLLFNNIKRPITIFKNIGGVYYDDLFNVISYEEALKKCFGKNLIIKPSINSGGGRDIIFIDARDTENENNINLKIKNEINNFHKDFIVQEVLIQHEDLRLFNKESVNTIRCISFLHNGEVHILSSVLRMGVDGAKVDNSAYGGISCGILSNGLLKSCAYDKKGNKFNQHPQGMIFKERLVPSYDQVLDIIKGEHKKFGHFKIISWDFAIDNTNKPVLIEYNIGFQEINFHQLNNGPLFGEFTNQVLEDVFKKDKG